VEQWCKANPRLAQRAGLPGAQASPQRGRHGSTKTVSHAHARDRRRSHRERRRG
jgi:hypothetical protein